MVKAIGTVFKLSPEPHDVRPGTLSHNFTSGLKRSGRAYANFSIEDGPNTGSYTVTGSLATDTIVLRNALMATNMPWEDKQGRWETFKSQMAHKSFNASGVNNEQPKAILPFPRRAVEKGQFSLVV